MTELRNSGGGVKLTEDYYIFTRRFGQFFDPAKGLLGLRGGV